MTQQTLPFRPARPNLLIEAGAGTGKTTEIVKEALTLLLEHPELEPERLVLITFTEKAAAEIGERIRDAMTDLYLTFDPGPAQWPSDTDKPILTVPPGKTESYRAACAKHLGHLDKIRSQTIHAFCQGILTSFPIEAGIDADFRVLEGFERSRLLQRSWGQFLEQETVTNPSEDRVEDWGIVLEHFTGLDRVRQTVLEMLQKRVLITDERYSLGDFLDASTKIHETIRLVKGFSKQEIGNVADLNARAVLSHLLTAEAPASDSIAEWLAFFEPIAIPLRDINLNKVPKELREGVRHLREDEFPSVYELLMEHRAATALRRLTCRFIDFLDREKVRQGLLDFDDLLLRTARLLDDDGIAAAVRAKFDYIFVDEFQDTDRVQARIIDRLARNQAGEIVHGRIVLVGDPKQSIYAFRHADPETYRDTLERFASAGAARRTLKRQYRSEPALVDSLNSMFRELFAAAGNENVYRPDYHELEAARPSQGVEAPHILFLRADAVSGESESVAEWKEGMAIAWYVREEVAKGRSFRDFAVLLRKTTNLPALLDAFDRCGIPYVVPPLGALLETRPIVDLLSVLRAIAAPFDLGAVVSAARTPYFGLSDDEIVSGVLAEGSEFARFQSLLSEYRKLSTQCGVAELIDRLLHDAEMELLYSLSKGGAESLRFLERFRQIAVEFDLAGGGSLGQFVDEQLRRREDSEEAQPTPTDDGRDALRVMTVHGSKGLEFPIVILPELSARTREDQLSVFAIENPKRLVMTGTISTLASRYLSVGKDSAGKDVVASEVGSKRRSAETDRLFYVAATRAQQKVVFVWSPARWGKSSFFKRLANLFGWEKGFNPFLPEPGLRVGAVTAGGRSIDAGFITPQPFDDSGETPSRFVSGEIDAIATAGERQADEPVTDTAVPSLSRADIIQRAAASANRGAGILLHRVLELWDGEAATLEVMLRELGKELGADTKTLEITRKRVSGLRSSPSFAKVMRSPVRGREVTVYYPGDDGSAVEARIDRLIEDEKGNLAVIDFKSGRPGPARALSDHEQVERYCAAIARISGRPCHGMLWYIDVDSDQLVDVV